MCKSHAHLDSIFDRAQFAEDLKRLSKVDGLRSVVTIATEYLIFAVAIFAAVWSNHWAVYIAAIGLIASRQHALGVLFHEAAHYRLFKSRKLNDWVSDFFLAFPMGISTALYRKYHGEHHRFVNDENDDPDRVAVHEDEDWKWPKSKWAGMLLFVRDLTGLSVFGLNKLVWARWSPWPHLIPGLMKNAKHQPKRSEMFRFVLWVAIVASILFWTNAWFYLFMLWIVPSATVLVAIFRLRALAEHYGIEETHELNHSRTVLTSWWERILIAPHNVNYHLEHHLFPSVPFFRLGQLHERLMQDDVFAREAHVTHGYMNMMREVFKAQDQISASSSNQREGAYSLASKTA